MGHTVTLGGERLGSGKKNKVELHGYERSTHDMGYIWRSTMSAGTLVPFMSKVALPGDTFDINLNAEIMTHPTVGPLFGSYKVQLDVFQCPIRLYQGQLHNNKLKIGMNMANVKLPIMELTSTKYNTSITDMDNSQINPSCILSYLGIRGVGYVNPALVPDPTPPPTRNFNAIPLLAYWDIYKQYYANKQEELGAYIHTIPVAIIQTIDVIEIDIAGTNVIIQQPPLTSGIGTDPNTGSIFINYTGARPLEYQIIFNTTAGYINFADLTTGNTTESAGQFYRSFNFQKWGYIGILNWSYISLTELPVTPPEVRNFPLAHIDSMREFLLSEILNPAAVKINDFGLEPYESLVEYTPNQIQSRMFTQEGLAVKTYQSDLFNNWLDTEWIDGANGISEITAIDTTEGSFTIDTLNLSKKVYNMLNRIAVSGGTYDDWLDSVYDHERFTRAESPIYHGGLIKELVFQEVVSNAESNTQPLGTLAGKGVMAKKHKGGQVRVKVDEPSYIISIISITPRIDYSQGNSWDTGLLTMDDFHKPALAEIGFQELITEQMAWWDVPYDPVLSQWTLKSAGKQPAWINYMTSVNEVRGNFAILNNEMFMTLNRRYEFNENTALDDLTTYIDPTKFNFIFAQTSLDAQNFWAQVSVDITARRKMSAKIMPNL